MAKFIIVRTNSKKEMAVVGNVFSADEARSVLLNDFQNYFWESVLNNNPTFPLPKVLLSDTSSFGEAYAKFEAEGMCELTENKAWLYDGHNIEFQWYIIETITKDILSDPLSMREMILAASDENPYVQGNVLIDLSDMVSIGYEDFLDLLSEKLTGSPCLMDIHYQLVDVKDQMVVMHVFGDVSDILSLNKEMFEELKTALFMDGTEALEDFADMDLSCYDDKDVIDSILDEIASQMPDEEQIRYYRKYICKSGTIEE